LPHKLVGGAPLLGCKAPAVDHENAEPRGDVEPVPPSGTRVDSFRAVVTALAELVPYGIGSAGAALLNHFLPTALERRTREFYELVALSIYQLRAGIRDVNERLAVAALVQGTLGAARSASEEHLEYLANATARAMTTSDEREADHAMLLLRIAGDISASHARLLEMYADPYKFAAKISKRFEWVRDEYGIYPLQQVPDSLDPEFAANPSFVRSLHGDLDRLGLLGDDSDESMDKVIDSGSGDPPTNMVTTLGRAVLAFVAAPAHDDHA
jgi:hypothetical protein